MRQYLRRLDEAVNATTTSQYTLGHDAYSVENDEESVEPTIFVLFGFFLFWNSVICLPTIKGLSSLLRGECSHHVVILICPHWLVGFVVPIYFASVWGFLGFVVLSVTFVLPYSIGILTEILACCQGERRCCPHLPTMHVQDRDSSRIAQGAANAENIGQQNSPTSTVNPSPTSNTDEIDLSNKTIRELEIYQNKILYTEEFSARLCSICLDDFRDGEEISRSMDSECKHIYHGNCIKEWLAAHDNCPICRRTYVTTSP